LIGGERAPWALPWLALTQDLNKRFLTKKIRPVMPILPSHAGIMPVTEKNPDYYWLSSQVLLHPKFRILKTEIWLRPKLGF